MSGRRYSSSVLTLVELVEALVVPARQAASPEGQQSPLIHTHPTGVSPHKPRPTKSRHTRTHATHVPTHDERTQLWRPQEEKREETSGKERECVCVCLFCVSLVSN